MTKTKVIFGAYNHTPFGSDDEDFEKAYLQRYKPFITSLYRFPSVPVSLHYSGVLLAWLEKKHPEFLMILEELVNRKQVELLGGGYYEPMMPLIPLADRIGQVELLTTYIRKHFGKRPRGCWLPGMMWEQSLLGSLQTCGMDYVFLEKDQFHAAGLSGFAAERPCLTEDQGKLMVVFPVCTKAGLDLATKDPESLIKSYAKEAPDGKARFVCLFPERYASPDASEATNEARLCALFEAFSRSEEEIELTNPLRVLKNYKVETKAYFPSSAEKKVMYWSMDESRRKGFDELINLEHKGVLNGSSSYFSASFPRQFLLRYPEANGIYSKMIYTHILINQLRGDKYRKRAAREELWKAQGCEGFWHVEDGGIYQNKIRKSMYAALIEAEKITREKGVFIPSVIPIDIDLDREREFLFQGSELNCYISAAGGSIFELDHLPKTWNYLDTLSRRHESYVQGDCVVDNYRRSAFIDRLLAPERSLQDAIAGKFKDSRFCAHEQYEEVSLDRVHHELVLKKPASFKGAFGSIEIIKKYQLKKHTLTVSYVLSNRGTIPERFNFVPEIDLSLAGDDKAVQSIRAIRAGLSETLVFAASEIKGLDELVVDDLKNSVPISLSSNNSFDLWLLPIRTRNRAEGIIKDHYQSTCLMPLFPIVLTPEESWKPASYSVSAAKYFLLSPSP
ncbi:DUF1926 domain-containing protein [Treponema sp.]